MTAITFDTHAYIKELKSAGFTEEQAEIQAKTLSSIFKTNLDELATRRDLKELELTIKAELRKEIETAKVETIKWVIATGIVILGGVATINRFFPPPVVYAMPPPSQEMRLPTISPTPQVSPPSAR